MGKKKWKAAGTALFIIALCVALVALNVLVSGIVDKYSLKIDMTSSGLYQISQESLDLLKGLDQPVTIYCISKGRDSIKEFSELLDKYGNASDFITVTYVDPYANPTFLDRLQAEGESVGLNTIIVECGSDRRVFSMADMYQFSSDGSKLVYFDAESRLTSAILNLASGETEKLQLVMGHGENMPEEFQSLAVQNNFDLSGIVLNKEVPDDCNVLMILAPQSDYSTDEIAVLDRFLARGGGILYFSDPSVPSLPNLDELMEEWGIAMNDDVVFDATNNIESNPVNVVAYYTEHEITEYFKTNQYYTVVPAARSLTLGETSDGKKLEAVLATSDDAYARDIDTEEKTTQRIAGDEAGPFLLAATSTKSMTAEDGTAVTARIFAMGSKRVYSDEMLSLTSVGNAKFMGNLLRWVSDTSGTTISIPPRQVGAQDIAVLPEAAYTCGVIYVIVIPVLIIAFGLRIYYKRKHL